MVPGIVKAALMALDLPYVGKALIDSVLKNSVF
jgi:hypothetical protein